MLKAARELDRLPFFLRLGARFVKEPPPDNPGATLWSAVVRFDRA